MAKGQLPELIFVHPVGHTKHKIRHLHVVFTIEEWDQFGIPRKLTLRRDNEIMDVETASNAGVEFMTGYVQGQMKEPYPDKANKKADDVEISKVPNIQARAMQERCAQLAEDLGKEQAKSDGEYWGVFIAKAIRAIKEIS